MYEYIRNYNFEHDDLIALVWLLRYINAWSLVCNCVTTIGSWLEQMPSTGRTSVRKCGQRCAVAQDACSISSGQSWPWLDRKNGLSPRGKRAPYYSAQVHSSVGCVTGFCACACTTHTCDM